MFFLIAWIANNIQKNINKYEIKRHKNKIREKSKYIYPKLYKIISETSIKVIYSISQKLNSNKHRL